MGKDEEKGPERSSKKIINEMRKGTKKLTLLHTRVVGEGSPNFPPSMDSRDDEIE